MHMNRQTLALGILVFAAAGHAQAAETRDAKACRALQAAIAPKQAGIADLTEARDASVELAETAGQAWDDVEILRLVSKAHAEAADREKALYEAAREKLASDELALQDAVQEFNAEVSKFNARCVPKR